MLDFITLTDGYKLDHRRQYPPGTEYVYSNFTARGTRVPGQDTVVFFGLQYFLQRYFTEIAEERFFSLPRMHVVSRYKQFLDGYLGPNDVGTAHIAALHELGYIPLRFCALPEGTEVPLRVPMFTVENTLPEFFWVTNYFETLLSSVLWLPCTSASTALRFSKILGDYAHQTGDPALVRWQGHDFSFRGMSSPEAAALSGAAHLLSFTGTDSVPSVGLLEQYYQGKGVGGSVPATEHSVMCAGGEAGELDTFRRLLALYPRGILSVVSDTWDLWTVVGAILPALHEEITAREGKLVIRPDSGDPVLILCGDASADRPLPRKGVVEALWEIFGGTTNGRGFRELDSHVGAIYGDSINEARAREICSRLMAKGFASTNVVLGIGSYAYQYVTRDTNQFAVKATWAQVDGVERLLHKDPKTDDGTKKSARGRLAVVEMDGDPLRLGVIDGLYRAEQTSVVGNLLERVWENGAFVRATTLAEMRARLGRLG